MTTQAGYDAVLRAMDLPGTPILSGETGMTWEIANDPIELPVRGDMGWSSVVEGAGRGTLRITVRALSDSDDVVADAIKQQASSKAGAQYSAVFPNGDQWNGRFVVERFSNESENTDVLRFNAVLRSTGPVLYSSS